METAIIPAINRQLVRAGLGMATTLLAYTVNDRTSVNSRVALSKFRRVYLSTPNVIQ